MINLINIEILTMKILFPFVRRNKSYIFTTKYNTFVTANGAVIHRTLNVLTKIFLRRLIQNKTIDRPNLQLLKTNN